MEIGVTNPKISVVGVRQFIKYYVKNVKVIWSTFTLMEYKKEKMHFTKEIYCKCYLHICTIKIWEYLKLIKEIAFLIINRQKNVALGPVNTDGISMAQSKQQKNSRSSGVRPTHISCTQNLKVAHLHMSLLLYSIHTEPTFFFVLLCIFFQF